MTRQVLLDVNMLIGVFDGDDTSDAHRRAREDFEALLSDPDVKFVITPLIRYEFLRGVRREQPEETQAALHEMTAALNDFREIAIRLEIGDRAAEVFRYAKDKRDDFLDKRSFDLFHCVCAEVYGLEFASQDSDVRKIQQLIQDSKQNAQTHRH